MVRVPSVGGCAREHFEVLRRFLRDTERVLTAHLSSVTTTYPSDRRGDAPDAEYDQRNHHEPAPTAANRVKRHEGELERTDRT